MVKLPEIADLTPTEATAADEWEEPEFDDELVPVPVGTNGNVLFNAPSHIRRDCRDALSYLSAGVLSEQDVKSCVKNIANIVNGNFRPREKSTAFKSLTGFAKFCKEQGDKKAPSAGEVNVGGNAIIISDSGKQRRETAADLLAEEAAKLGFSDVAAGILSEEEAGGRSFEAARVISGTLEEGAGSEKPSS